MALKERDLDILNFIESYITQHGYAPSYRDIVNGCQLSSTAQVQLSLQSLESGGQIRWWPGIARGIQLRKNGQAER